MLDSLDNPIWFALTTEHQFLARSHGLARRYPPDVSPLAALLHPTDDGFADLQRLVSPGEHVALFTASPIDVPGGWQVDRSRWIDQMSCEASLAPPPGAPLQLGTTDVPEMLELTAATEPGPFLPQTIQMGSYFGIRASDGRLVAMAGERLQSTGFAEISAVCTHPDFRGRGYARDLVTFLTSQILAAGKTPFLHVKSENGAKVVYQEIGFRLRAAIRLTVVSLR
ncbi:MAG TPA: GNAT family N-acetyltransferase [Candidatus Sulfotelmatobacter sp.]|nr:GNAT family N-acetyltransferase [Candidatus Sulfotelmatobacter sp.]HUE52018.1 GNAT family N-acetyltransferase [Terriglobales bacterium]